MESDEPTQQTRCAWEMEIIPSLIIDPKEKGSRYKDSMVRDDPK